jgi:Leucine-rich repeat (LRR) protein
MSKIIVIFICTAVLKSIAGDRPLICDAKDNTCTFNSKVLYENQNASIFVDRNDNRCDDLDVTKVFFTSSSIYYIPSELFTVFQNIDYLELKTQHVKEIRSGTFNDAKSLRSLQLHSNKITKLMAYNLRADNLKELYIQNNQIEKIDENAFMGSTALEIVHLCGNKLKGIPEKLFKNLFKLKNLSFNYNQIEFLPPNLFSNNYYLETLHLRVNRFKTISHKMFSHLINIRNLYLNGNICIDKIYTTDAFAVMGTIENNLVNCTIGTVETSITESPGKLWEILNKMDQKFDTLEKTVKKIEGQMNSPA